MDVPFIKRRRLNAETCRPRFHIRVCRGYGFLHNLAQVSGDDHVALARQHHAFNGKKFAAEFGPGKSGHDSDSVLLFEHGAPVFWNSGKIAEVVGGDFHGAALGFAGEQTPHGFPCQ